MSKFRKYFSSNKYVQSICFFFVLFVKDVLEMHNMHDKIINLSINKHFISNFLIFCMIWISPECKQYTIRELWFVICDLEGSIYCKVKSTYHLRSKFLSPSIFFLWAMGYLFCFVLKWSLKTPKLKDHWLEI